MYPNDYSLNYHNEEIVAFFSLPYEALNNWSAHRVHIFEHDFQTVEAAFQYAKFKNVAPDVAEQIVAAPSPWKVFQITNKNRQLTPDTWKADKASVMEQIIRAKVAQNDDVRERLLSTGNKRIIENSPWDAFWGVGADGTGENVLGEIYMRIRSELQP